MSYKEQRKSINVDLSLWLGSMRSASRRHRRSAAILVWFTLLLPLLLGIMGLVIDAGLLMASHRHLQNGVDAAAMAGAADFMSNLTAFEARTTAKKFILTHHGFPDADVQVYSPPQSGLYAGEEGYVEVIAEFETRTIFMQLLNGVHKTRGARARAVAGAERNEIIDGIFALEHRKGNGLVVTGNAHLRASGRIIVNSENGAVDENGAPVGPPGHAAFVTPFASVKAEEVYVVGNVNREDRFQNIEPGEASPLKTNQLPVPDPFMHIPTPTIANGVIDVQRGTAIASPDQMVLIHPHDDTLSPNYIETDPDTGQQTMVLNPGIYSSIDITAGNVRFNPGIYVLAAPRDKAYSLRILDGNIEAQGIMFYNTREEYDPITGQPDASDGGYLPETDGADTGQIRINAALGFSAIDTLKYQYTGAAPSISDYNGLLIYQRRRNIATLQIQGFTENNTVNGVIYAKWAKLRLPAGGILNSQLVVGTLTVPGHGDLFVNHDPADAIHSKDIFLVE